MRGEPPKNSSGLISLRSIASIFVTITVSLIQHFLVQCKRIYSMKRAVIFVNGNRPSRDLVFEVLKTTDTIICADRGAKHAIDCGVTPNVILGDLDSLSKTLQ